jgi:hypothetical protein
MTTRIGTFQWTPFTRSLSFRSHIHLSMPWTRIERHGQFWINNNAHWLFRLNHLWKFAPNAHDQALSFNPFGTCLSGIDFILDVDVLTKVYEVYRHGVSEFIQGPWPWRTTEKKQDRYQISSLRAFTRVCQLSLRHLIMLRWWCFLELSSVRKPQVWI